jgi:hypothetical protein
MTIPQKGWVSPFGNPGINECSPLPRAYRSVPRPSSPLDAKASTRCPSLARPAPAATRIPPMKSSTSREPRRRAAPQPSNEAEPVHGHAAFEHTHANGRTPRASLRCDGRPRAQAVKPDLSHVRTCADGSRAPDERELVWGTNQQPPYDVQQEHMNRAWPAIPSDRAAFAPSYSNSFHTPSRPLLTAPRRAAVQGQVPMRSARSQDLPSAMNGRSHGVQLVGPG